MSDLETLRAQVRDAAKSLSPREIADRAGVSHQTVYDLIAEGSTTSPQRGTVRKLARFLTELDRERTARPSAVPVAPTEPDTSDQMPGYWIGQVRAFAAMAVTLHRELSAMADAGPRWELASAVAQEARAARTTPPAAEATEGEVSPERAALEYQNAWASWVVSQRASGGPLPPGVSRDRGAPIPPAPALRDAGLPAPEQPTTPPPTRRTA